MDKKNRKWTLWRILSISQWKSIEDYMERTSYVLGCIKKSVSLIICLYGHSPILMN